jgi:non-ribosomal peptide synthetase component F
MEIFRRELVSLYEAYSQGRSSPLPEPAVQFADYAVWEGRVLGAQLFQTDICFWMRKLAGISAEEVDAKQLRANPFAPLETECIHIHETLWSDLKNLAREENCTPAAVISAALGMVSGHYGARNDITIAMLVANRANLGVQHTIGHFVNTVIVRIQISTRTTVRQILRDIRTQMVQAITHQQYPFEDLVRILKSQDVHYEKSLFQVLLSYQPFSPVSSQNPGLTFAHFPISHVEATPTRFDMVCRLREDSTTLTGTVNRRVDAFSQHMSPEVATLAVELLKRIVAFPDERVSEILDEAQFRQC